MRIDVTVDSSPERWGPECSADLATRAAETLARWIAEALAEVYPAAEVLHGTRDYTEGESTKLVTVSGCTPATWDRIHDIAASINGELWTDAIASVLPRRRGAPRGERKDRRQITLPMELSEWLQRQPDGTSGTIVKALEAWRASAGKDGK
jgi:hypothetical protein